jgi:Kdo2-lipid IVA lauroyltransferase/acyltransferase
VRIEDMESKLRFARFRDYVVYLVVRFLDETLNLIPEAAAMAIGRLLGRFAYIILPDRRRAAEENLTIAFGKEKSRHWIERTAFKSFEHLGLLGIEFFRIRRWSQKQMAERIILEGRLPYNLAMMPGKDGIYLLNSHFGCFEVSAATMKFLGANLNLLATRLKNPFLTRYLFSRAGKNTGIKTFPHKGAVKTLIGKMGNGEMVAVLADQRGDAERGIFVDYFGAPAPANEVFAKIEIEGEGRVLPLCTYRVGDGTYKSVFGEEIRIRLTGDRRRDLIAVSQQFHDQFERWVRMYPEQGYWVQRKWRRTPSRRRSRKK